MKKNVLTTGFVFFVRVLMLLSLTLTQFAGTIKPVSAVGEKVGLVTDTGGIADQSFNYNAYQGLLQAEISLGIDGSLYEPASEGDYLSALQQCVTDGNVLCIAVGFMMGDPINSAAIANPGVSFAILDYSPAAPPVNLQGILFNEKESGFLAGALAGKMTTSNTIGVVGGWAIPPVIKFAEGYRNGALCANSNANVLINYTGTFTDPALGATTAQEMMAQGADVIFGAAGPTGNGAILYSAQNGAWSIGVDTDQYLSVFGNGTVSGSDKMLTSAMKRLDTAVIETISDYLGGTFSSGTVQYNLINDGVGLAPYHETDASIPQITKDYVDAVTAGIIAGTTDINDTCRPTISGKIMDGADNPISAMVRAVLKSDGSEVAATVSNPADGIYTLTGLPLDTDLAVVASDEDPDTDGYSPRYYNNVSAADWAETIALTSGSPDRPGVDIRLTTGGATVEQLTFNVRAGRLLNDGEIRWAIGYGTDRQSILNDAFVPVGQTGEVMHSMVAPGLLYKAASDDPLLTVYDFNTTTARNILTAADWIDRDSDGIRENALNEDLALDFITTTAAVRVASANLFKSQMADIGILINVINYPASDFFNPDPAISPLAAGNFDIAEFAWVLGDDDALLGVYNTGDSQNHGGYSNATLDGYFNNARDAKVAGNSAVFQSNALLWQYAFSEDLPALPMFTRIPLPTITVQPVHGWVAGNGWPVGNTVTLTVDDDANPLNGTLYFDTQTVAGDNSVWFGNVESAVDLVPGQYITLDDGTTTKVLQITDVQFDSVNEATDIAAGSGPANRPASVYIRTNVGENNLNITIGSDGNWTADFSGLLDLTNIQDANIQDYDDDGDGTMAHLRIPHLDVWYMNDYLNAYDWPIGTTLDLTIVNAPNPDYTTTTTVEPDYTGRFDLNGLFDILPGMTVRVSGASLTRELVVSNLIITSVDEVLDKVSGTTEPNKNMWMWFGPSCCRSFTADGSGNWSVDYSVPGPGGEPIADLGPGSNGTANAQDDDGDNTSVDWNISNPNIQVRANEDRVEGWQWPVGSMVTIEVSRIGGNITRTAEVFGSAPWGDPTPYFQYNFGGEFDIQPGDLVSVTDGITTKTTTVSPLAFTNIDLVTDVVTGVANPGANVDIWVCNGSDCNYNRHVAADGTTGIWTADFSSVGPQSDEKTTVDIGPGTWIDSSEYDGNSNSTMYGVTVPNPFIEANPSGNWVHAREWHKGTLMTMEIDDLSNGLGGVDYTRTATMDQAPWNPGDPNDIVADFDMSGFTVETGDVITISGDLDGTLRIKTLTVTDLHTTFFDVAADTVFGVATPGASVEVCINIPNNCISRSVIANGVDGIWTANYNPDYDLQSGDNGWAAEYDADSDRTWYDWNVPADTTPPTVMSIVRASANPTSAVSVNYTVTFSESVTDVDAGDFNLTTKRLTGAAVSGVSGSGSVYTVTVNTGSGNGNIRLNVTDNNSILDGTSNPLGGGTLGDGNFANGEYFTVIKTTTFVDVPLAYWSNSSIERLYNAGITGGCTTIPLAYCPTTSVTRAQMAIFLLRGIHGSAYTPPPATGTRFTDVPLGSFAAAWIEQLATEGITSGCGGGNYCPNTTVSRAQMAIFLVRAKHGSTFIPPTATGIFLDVPVGSFGANFIEQLVTDAITSGCGSGNFCPNTMVKRDSMAVFLVKTFNLP